MSIESERKDLADNDRIAVVASFGTSTTVARSLEAMVMGLEKCNYSVIVVRASDDSTPLRWSKAYSGNAVIVRKPNVGYDFGSWALALHIYPQLRTRRFVLLTNDSLVGPFESLTGVIADFEASPGDVWSATNTTQFFPHIQSFFMGFHSGVLDDPAVKDFWFSLRVETDKQRIIGKYELGFSQLLFGEGFAVSSGFASERVVAAGLNPSITGWRRLVELGFPFVKRELILNPTLVHDGGHIPEFIQSKYGIDPRTWI
ncbi:MAG: hypothetical protein H7288_09140 [Kineosporiaceae bacterium]|nr:hypothetical protein [Aeromicrobium sp.]